MFGKGIQACHARVGIGGDHCIADGVERNGKHFLADLQGPGFKQDLLTAELGEASTLAASPARVVSFTVSDRVDFR